MSAPLRTTLSALPLCAALAWPLAAAGAAAACAPDTPPAPSPAESLTLGVALERALSRHPELVVAECELAAAEARLLQAGLRPNPQAGFEVENVAGSGRLRELDSAETTLQIGQLVELGGKRAKRRGLAGLERDLAAWDREGRRLGVIAATRRAYVELLAAQARLALAEELATLARDVERGVAARVEAGRVSPIERTRARIAVSDAALVRDRARAALETARRRLALRWGADEPDFGEARGDLRQLPPAPSLGALQAALSANPALARWQTEDEQRRRALELAEADAVPDLTLSGGLRQFAGSGDVGLVFGVALPLPLFDRNQGAIAAARATLAATDAARDATRLQLLDVLQASHAAQAAAASELARLDTEVLPLARQVFDQTTTGYEAGKFGYLDVLEAQRTLFEARSRELDALVRYHAASAELEALIGASLDTLPAAPAAALRGRTP